MNFELSYCFNTDTIRIASAVSVSDQQHLQCDEFYGNTDHQQENFIQELFSPVGIFIRSVLLKFTRNDQK